MIYLDHNATTPMPAEVVTSVAEAMSEGYANPASQHAAGRQARAELERSRDGIRALLRCRTSGHGIDRVIYTSGGTEANNLAIRGMSGAGRGRIVISAIEHPCISEAANEMERRGYELIRLPANLDGLIELESLKDALTPQTRLVSLMLANHETGVIQPVAEAATICQQMGVPLHTDAVQAVGKIDVSFSKLGVTAMTVSAHKFHGPCGIGCLITTRDAQLEPILWGGGQQLEMRPGTESIALPKGMEKALSWSQDHTVSAMERIKTLRDLFESELTNRLPDVRINGGGVARLPNTSSLAFLGVNRQALLMALDQQGIACSTGSACASGSSEPSPVLLGMSCPPEIVASSLRFSLGPHTSDSEIDQAVDLITKTVQRLRR